MGERISISDLPCYHTPEGLAAIENDKRITPGRGFDVGKLPVELRAGVTRYIYDIGGRLRVRSVCSEITPFNQLCNFISDQVPDLQTFQADGLEDKLKMWLLKNGQKIAYERTIFGQYTKRQENPCILLLRRLIKFTEPVDLRPEMEKDIWELDKIDLFIKKNPIKAVKTLNFTHIPQQAIREEIKKVMYLRLSGGKALGTVLGEMAAINRFTTYLQDQVQDVQSLLELDREIIEGYLIYINTVVKSKKDFRTELISLKTIFELYSKVAEAPHIEQLILNRDIPTSPVKQYRTYSEAELERWYKGFLLLPPQMARAMVIHQLLGTRISDALTLKVDCISSRNGNYFIRIDQVKTRSYTKPASAEIVALVEKSIEYTHQNYGDTSYIFVRDSNPAEPFQYSMIQNRLMQIIREQDLRDDNGNLFGVTTHMFRNCLGQRLTEMHVDDLTIAQLLGHSGISSVWRYRKMGNAALAEETRAVRQHLSDIIFDIVKGWEGYGEI